MFMKLLSAQAAFAGGGAIAIVSLLTAAISCPSAGGTGLSEIQNAAAESEAAATMTEDSWSDAVESCGLKLEAGTISFGTVYEGSKNSHPLKLTNDTDQPIVIQEANASCGCTTVLTETPFVVEPRQQGSLKIQMNTANNTGDLEKIVTIFVREGSARYRIPVKVRAHSLPVMNISCREMDFGMIRSADSATRELIVTLNHEPETAQGKGDVRIASQPQGVKADLTEVAAPEHAARQWKVCVKVSGEDVPEESIDGDLVMFTPSTIEPVVRIPIRAKQFSVVFCEPARVNFGAVRKESDLRKTVSLKCPHGHKFDLLGVELTDGPDFLTVESGAGASEILLKIDPESSGQGFFRSRLEVRYRADDGPRQTLSIPIVGYRLAQGG